MILKLQILAITLLLSAMAYSISYWMSPEEFGKELWANSNLVNELSDACSTADNPKHCFGIWLAISKAESQMGNDPKAVSHWYFWRVAGKDKSAYWFVKTYKNYYYIVDKYNEWWMFYGYWPKNPAPTQYCMSEKSSNSVWHCPNGRASFNWVYDQYKEKVMSATTKAIPLRRQVADKFPVWTKKRCKIIYKADANWYLQQDTIMGKFVAWLRGIRKGDKIFFCYDI